MGLAAIGQIQEQMFRKESSMSVLSDAGGD